MNRLLGKRAMYRYDDTALKGEERAALLERLPAMAEAAANAKAELEARKLELLKDPRYCALLKAYGEASKAHSDAAAKARRRRVTVGRDEGMFFCVKAEGDNWQEAIDNLKKALAPRTCG